MAFASHRLRIAGYGTALGALLLISTCSPRPTAVDKVRALGVLRAATVNSPTTCYDGPAGKIGYECDLLRGLAKKLGVQLKLQFFRNDSAVLDAVRSGRAEIGAAAINVTPLRQQQVLLSAPLQNTTLQLVYNEDREPPADLAAVRGRLVVVAGSAAAERLAELKARYPNLKWEESAAVGAEELLYEVADGDLDYTIANADLIAIDQRYYPKVRVAFDVSDLQHTAWALQPGPDDSLFRAVQNYLQELGDAELARLRDGYFQHVGEADYQGVTRFAEDVENRLPHYRSAFEDAAERYGLDWRVLAAIGYQESRWDPRAVSPTGVRGLMMLTMDTAGDVEVGNREDARQSIYGGARYLQYILKQLPPEIEEPDRTWMALAAYNQGIGHLLDARQLVAQFGGDANSWLDVRDALPLLARERWFAKTHYGYARGQEAVAYVGNVRNYYDILSWMTNPPAGGNRTANSAPARGGSAAFKSSGARPAVP